MGFPWGSVVKTSLPAVPEPQEIWVWSLGWEDPLEEVMASTPMFLPGESPWTEEPGGLQSIGSQRVRDDWSDSVHARTLCYGIFQIQFSSSLMTQGPCFESEWLPCPGTQAWPQSGRWRSWPFSHPPSCSSPLLSLLHPSIHTSTITLTTWRPKYLSIQVFGLRPPCSGQGPGLQWSVCCWTKSSLGPT